jgi:diguanylate cyclase (GGDEF)-like protein
MVAVTCLILALRVVTPLERRFWALLSAACTSLLIGETYWTWFAATVDPRGPGFDGPYKWFEVLAAALYCVLIATMTRLGGWRISARARAYLDVLAVMVAVYPFVYALWVYPALTGTPGAVRVAAWVSAWPVFGVAMLAATVAVMGGYKAFRWRSWERLITGSIAVFATGMVLFPVWYPQLLASGAGQVTWYNLVLGIGAYILFVAAVYRLTAGQNETIAEPWPVTTRAYPRLAVIYPVALVAALPLIALLAYGLQRGPAEGPVLGAGIILALLLGLRSWLHATELAAHRVAAITDPLTGTLSTQLLNARLGLLVDDARAFGEPLSLVYVRIDDFARLDSVHGRDVMDRLIVSVAKRVTEACGSDSEVYRLNDDGFVAIARGMGQRDAAEFALGVSTGLTDTSARAQVLPFTHSIGVATFPDAAGNAGDLITCARVAADQAQNQATEAVHVYAPGDMEADGGVARPVRVGRRATLESLEALADAVDERDPATAGHARGVAAIAEQLADSLGLSSDATVSVRIAALLHDVGKIGVDPVLLRSAGPLTTDERKRLERHADLSARIVAASGLGAVAPIVRSHHERWDGEGYPTGLRGPAIPLSARVLAVCDAFETLIAGRHRPPLSEAEALAELQANSGTQFDPDVAAEFVALRSGGAQNAAAAGSEATGAP